MRALHSVWMGLLLTSLLLAQSPHSGSSATTATQKGQQPVSAAPTPQFEDVAARVRLTVPHISSPDKKYIVESMSGGVGLIDCDNDGKLDIITVNGSTVQRYRQGGDLLIT